MKTEGQNAQQNPRFWKFMEIRIYMNLYFHQKIRANQNTMSFRIKNINNMDSPEETWIENGHDHWAQQNPSSVWLMMVNC